jgi:diguanylate cyclase (GGDEF)-like protein/PAS domain S-box-containing protein
MFSNTDPVLAVEAETQRQKTALLYRNSGIAQAVNIANATLLAYVVVSLHISVRVTFIWWCFAITIAGGRYVLARRFLAAQPDAIAAVAWRRRYMVGTVLMAGTWGATTLLFMWYAANEMFLFTGLVLAGMVAGALPLLAPVPVAFVLYVALVCVPMSAVVLLQADSPLRWVFGVMSLVFLAAMLASARYLHETLDVAIRLGLEQGRMVERLERARSAAEAALVERKGLEEGMRRERDFAESLIDTAQATVLVLDTEGRIVRFNRYFEEVSGYLLEEVRGASWSAKFLPHGDQAVIQTLVKKPLTDFRTEVNINAIIAKDGREILLEWSHKTLKDSAGNVVGLLAIGQDVTAREKLNESQRLLKAAVEQSSSSIMVTDYDSRIVFVNAGFVQTTGYSVAEATGQTPSILKSGLTPPETYRELWQTLARRQAWRGELCNRKKNGELYWEAASISPIVDADGRITHYLAVKDDITRKKLAEERLALALRGADLALSDWHIASDVLVFGDGWTKLLGYQPEEFHPRVSTLVGLLNPEDMPAIRNAVVRHLKGWTPFIEVEVRLRHKDGRWIWVLVRAMVVERAADGRALRLAGTTMDITTRKHAAAEVTRLSQWNELLLNSAGEGIYGTDSAGNCTFANPAALEILGFEKEELLGKSSHWMFHHHHPDGSPYSVEDCPIHLTRVDGVKRQVEDEFIRKSGAAFPVKLSVTSMLQESQVVGVVVVFRDITIRKGLEQELTRLATTDPLTGVANRRRFIDQLEMELARTRRFDKPAAFLMMDIDNFKQVNDTHGHAVGDAVLQHLAELSRHRLRRVDLFGRLGGEEFGILLPGTDAAGARELAEGFRRYVADTPLASSKGAIPMTVSIGVVTFESGDTAPDSILARADVALYRAKEAGRNRVEMN